MRAPDGMELLLGYCARRLDLETASALEGHIAACPACQAWTQSQSRVWMALEAWEPAPVSADFDRRLYARFATEREGRGWWGTLLRPWLGLSGLRPALSLGLAGLLVVVAFWMQKPTTTPSPAPTQAQTEALDPDRLEMALDDVEMLRQLSLMGTPDSPPR
ncbi:MAG: hypothetical protein ABSD56_08935 [Bryobacteraceae bacterium]